MSKEFTELVARITAYLSSGGLFNPELAIHQAVSDLLIECRAGLLNIGRANAELHLELVDANARAEICWKPIAMLPNKNGFYHVWHEAFPLECAQSEFRNGNWYYMDGDVWIGNQFQYWRPFPPLPLAARTLVTSEAPVE